jgi:tRNA uridine 5-carboxymethylaminomethyl modification enzyme
MVRGLLPVDVRKVVKMTDLETSLADSLYSGYVRNLKLATERVNHNDNLRIPDTFQFNGLSGLSNEMKERLTRAQPQTFGQVRKISGLTPAALSTVLVHLTARKTQKII